MRHFASLAGCVSVALTCSWVAVVSAPAADGNWYQVPEASIPANGSRPHYGLATAVDTRRDRALVFGGLFPSIHFGPGSNSPPSVSPEVQVMDPGHGIQILPVTGDRPPGACYSAAAYDSLADRLWVFGGDTIVSAYPGYPTGQSARVWSLDLSLSPPVWSQVVPGGVPPAARAGHSMIFDRAGRRLLVFGGRDAGGAPLTDLWSLTVDGTPAWTRILPGGAEPTGRYEHGAVYDPAGQRMLVAGGVRGPLDTASPAGVWALNLAGAPQWDSLVTSGAQPPGVARGMGFDRARNRLLLAPTAASTWALDLGSAPPAWHALEFVPDPSASTSSVHGMGFDDHRDVLYLPAADPHPIYYYGQPWVPVHFLIAFDQAPRAIAEPHLIDNVWFHGAARQRWQMNLSGMFWSFPHLERRAGTGTPADGGRDVARDEAAGTLDFVDAGAPAGTDLGYRLTWRDYAAAYVSSDTLLHAPAAPAAMPASVDSAYIAGGRAHLQWTFANDSLGWLEAPIVWRRSTLLGWEPLGVRWPDDQRRVTCVDTTVLGGEEYTYEVRWNQSGTVRSTGSVDLALGPPTVWLFEATRDFRDVFIRWRVTGTSAFEATLDRRAAAGAWVAVDTLVADTTRSLVATEDGLPLGSHVEYRLRWSTGGAEASSAAVPFDVEPFQALVQTGRAGTDHVALGWYLTPLDTLTTIQVQRRPVGDTAWVAVGAAFRDTVQSLAIEDAGLAAGTLCEYRVLANDGAELHPSGDLTIETYAAPVHVSTAVSPGVATLKWTHCRLATGYRVWRRVNAGAFQLRPTPSVGADSLVVLADNGIPTADSLTYRLEWLEEDLLWRPTPTVKVDPQAGAGTTASLVAIEPGPTWIRTRWWVAATDPGFVFQLLRRSGVSAAWDTLATLANSAGAEREYLDEAVGPDTTYHYRVEWSMGGIVGSTPEASAALPDPPSGASMTIESGNPTHGTASIGYSLPDARPATCELIDVRGRLRATRQDTGPGRFTWVLPAGTVEPGVFFLRLRGDGFTLTRRLVLVP